MRRAKSAAAGTAFASRDGRAFVAYGALFLLAQLGLLGVFRLSPSPSDSSRLNLVPILTVDTITPLDLYLEHGREPVIIKGALRRHPLMRNASLDYVSEVCGDGYIDTVVYDPEATEWAGHVGEKMMRIRDYVASLRSGGDDDDDDDDDGLRYAHSNTFGMPFMCPALQHDMLVPAVASKNLPTGGGIVNLGQPTIFMGPAGTRSEIHMDMFLLPFWLSVYVGTKKFRVILFEDTITHLDSESIIEGGRMLSEDGEASLEIWNPDLSLFPDLAKVRVFEGEVSAGDVIFVPSGALHGIYNAEETFAATANMLYGPLTTHYAEVCANSNFANGCLKNLKATYLHACDEEADALVPMNNKTIEAFAKCALNSPANRKIGAAESYKRNLGFRDTFLWEIHEKKNYKEWCEEVCVMYVKLDYAQSILTDRQSKVCEDQCKILRSRLTANQNTPS